MPPKHNRNRNTITISTGNHFLKSNYCRFDSQSTSTIESLSTSQKTFLNLKLLEKCQEKMVNCKENECIDMVDYQQKANKILTEIRPQTIQETIRQKLKGSDRFLQLNKRFHRKTSQNLISSWTAFENLDITYKTRQDELIRQNKDLLNNLAAMERKLKTLYPSVCQNVEKSLMNQKETHNLLCTNLETIEKRIVEHQKLIQKLREKIKKKEDEQIEVTDLLNELIQKVGQKYGFVTVQKIKELLKAL